MWSYWGKIGDSNMISEKLNSTTLGEICNFLDPNYENNVSYTRFTDFCTRYFYKELTNEIDSKIILESYSFRQLCSKLSAGFNRK